MGIEVQKPVAGAAVLGVPAVMTLLFHEAEEVWQD
jgi:hypothetical protein